MSEDAAVTLDFTSSLWRKEDPKTPSYYTSTAPEGASAETVELKAQLDEAQKRLTELAALIEANAETESTTQQNATDAQVNSERADLKASDAVIQSDEAFAEAQRAWNEAHDTAEALFGVSTKADLADLKAQEAWNAAVSMGISMAEADNQISIQDDLENQLFDVVAYGSTIVSSNVNLLTSEGLSGRVIYQPGPPSSSTEVSPNNIWVRTSDDLPFWWNNTTWIEIETPATLVAASEASDDLRLTVLPRTITYSATSPGAPEAGDIWVETDTGNTVRYWNLSAWVAAPKLVSDLFSDPMYPEDHKVTGSVRIFAQSTDPSGQLVTGDLWLDINNGNALSRWNGSGWTRYGLKDSEALQEALELIHGVVQEQVDAKITTHYGSSAPVDPSIGDLWVDTGNNRLLKRWGGDKWEPIDDARIQDAVTRIENAESLLDSKIRTFAQDDPPAGLTASDVGDLWIDTNDSNKIYRWQLSGGSYQWVILRDAGIQQAITTAGGKNKIIRSTSNASGTTGYVSGDLWWKYSSDDFTGPIIAQWTYTAGTGWKASSIGSEVIANLTVDKLVATGGAEFPVAVVDTLVNQDAFINRLTTERIMVGNFTNLIPNGDVSRGRLAPWDTRFTMDTVDKPTGLIASLVGPATTQTWTNGQQPDTWIEVNPGQKYIFDIWLKADKPSSRFYMELEDQNTALAVSSKIDVDDGGESTGGGNYLLNNIEVPTTWTRFSDIIVVGTGVQRVRLGGIDFNHSGGVEQTATVKIAGARLRPIAGSDLIDNDFVSGIQQNIADVQQSASLEVATATDYITNEWGTQFATSTEVDTKVEGVSNEVSGAYSDLSTQIGGVQDNLNSFEALYNLWKDELDLYVQIASNGIILGNRTGTNNFRVHITNTEMGFYDGTKKVAYLSNNRLYITDAEIINKLSLGSPAKGYFSFEPNTSNGNLSLKYRK